MTGIFNLRFFNRRFFNLRFGFFSWLGALRRPWLALALSGCLATAAFAQGATAPPTISKAFSQASVALDNSVTLTFTLTNPNGGAELDGISISDTMPAGLIIANPDSVTSDCDPGVIATSTNAISLSGGILAAAGSCTFSVDVLAVAGGDQVNTTGNISSTNGGAGGTATATVTVLLPDLTIAKSHSGNFRQTQTGAAYSITVTNVGGATTTDVVTVTDTLPAGLTATSISGVGWSCGAPPILQCARGDTLDPANSYPPINVLVNVAANAPTSVTNMAAVSGGGETNLANDTASDLTMITSVGDLAISKTHNGSFSPGQTGATYSLVVSNLGPGPTLGAVMVTDTLPNVSNTLAPTAMSGAGWNCDLPSLTCTRGDALAAGASYPPIVLTVNVPANIPPNVTNTATVSGGGELNTSNDTASDQTHIGAPLQIVSQLAALQVAAGGTTSTVLNVNSSSSLGAITFSCGNLPAGAGCSFSPSSVTQLTSQVTMTLTTAARASSIPAAWKGTWPPFYAAMLAGMLAMMLASGQKRRKHVALFLAGAALLLALTSCGGGGNGATGTPAGSSSITVTATSASTGESTNLTLGLTVL